MFQPLADYHRSAGIVHAHRSIVNDAGARIDIDEWSPLFLRVPAFGRTTGNVQAPRVAERLCGVGLCTWTGGL